MVAIMRRYQVLDIDIAMETIMNAWFEQRHENRRLLAKTIEAHRVIENGEQRLSFARLVVHACCQPRGLKMPILPPVVSDSHPCR